MRRSRYGTRADELRGAGLQEPLARKARIRPSAPQSALHVGSEAPTHQSRRGSGAQRPEADRRGASRTPAPAPAPLWGRAPRDHPSPRDARARRPRFRVRRAARAPQVPARLPSWLRWRRPGSRGAVAEGATALGEVGPPRAEEPPPAATPPPPSKASQALPGTAAAPWTLPVHVTPVFPSAPPVPALSCSFTR